MIISEVDAILNLVVKATSFCSLVQDGWYKGSAELDSFRDKVLMLSAKHSQWSEQLRRYGVSEDKHLLLLVTLAEETLETQQESLQKLQRSPWRRFKKRAFPGQLSYLLDKVLEIVDAGPQLLAAKVANCDLLERFTAQAPASLSFGQDTNYVPIVGTILKLQSALESAEGPRVVTVYGGPGMGKSSLVKYLAIHYQEEKRLRMHASLPKPAVFPDGVYYLFCGQQANVRVKQLQLELLQSLGFGTGYATPTDSTSMSGGQDGDFLPVLSPQMKVTSRLAEQKLLIILDDLWEETVLQEVLVPAKGVKYLVTSQMRDIHVTAKKIQIRRPTHAEASQMMANYTDGLPERGKFPPNIQIVTDNIIRKLEYHPLALANIGISINSSRATDTSEWDVIKENLYAHLDENYFRTPPVYDRPYNLPVSASMMLMVDSLPIEKQRLLFLIALLEGQSLPEPLVKFFYRFLQPRNFAIKYNTHERFLEDKSLLELRVNKGSGSILNSHSLRSHYIREKRALEVRSLGSEILVASGAQDLAEPIGMGNTEGTLATVLSAIYYEQSLKDVVASTLENHIKLINGGIIPRSLNMGAETMDLVERARQHIKYQIEDLVWLLSTDQEEGNWKQQAHDYAKKIIIKFVVCRGKLDDDSMAGLLRLPQTTSVACLALIKMCSWHSADFYDRDISFSSAHGEIMQTLLALFHRNGIAIERRRAVMVSLLHVLDYESEETIFKVAEKYKALLAMDSNPSFQAAIIKVLCGDMERVSRRGSIRPSGRGVWTLAEFPGLLEDLMALLLLGENHEVRESAGRSILHFSGKRRIPLRIAVFPNALQMLFDSIISDDSLQETAGEILSCLSIVPESRIQFREIQGIWEGLGSILAKLEDAWRATRDWHHRRKLKKRSSVAATIFGYLGLEKDLRDAIASLPGVREGLLFLQLNEMAGHWNYKRSGFDDQDHSNSSREWLLNFYCSTRALTVLYSNPADQRFTSLPPLEEVLKMIAFDEGPQSKSIAMASAVPDIGYFSIYWTRVLAYIQMGSYGESLSNLDLAHGHLDLIPRPSSRYQYCQFSSQGYTSCTRYCLTSSVLSDCRVFLQAMQKDYAGALSGDKPLNLTQTGILKWLSGDLQAALDDLNAAAVKPFNNDSNILKHRRHVKYLMGDETGARKDAEAAKKLELKKRNVDEISFDQGG